MSKKKAEPYPPLHYRDRMLARLRAAHADDVLQAFAEDKAILLPTETLAEWPMHKVPATKEGMETLSAAVREFSNTKTQPPLPVSPPPALIQTLAATQSATAEADKIVNAKADEIDLKRTKRSGKPQRAVTIDRLPPHELEMEQGVLGCQLIAPNECIPEVIEKFKGDPDRHYDLRHSTLQKTLFEMFAEQRPIDVITFQQRLKDKQILEQVGGIGYISGLPDVVPSAANLSYYLDIVCEKYVLRKMIHTCTDVVARIYDYEGELAELVDETERDILKATGLFRGGKEKPNVKELVKKTLDNIERRWENKGALSGLSTGFTDLDKMTDGMHGGELWIIAGFQSMGKTALAMNIAEYVALELKQPVGIFSYEMTAEALMLRLVCCRARVNLRNINEGFVSERDFPKLTGSAGKLANSQFHIDDESDANILELRAKARRMVQEHGVKLFVVDYLQKVKGVTSRKNDSREQEVASVGDGLKNMAKELNVPVIAISAVNDDGRMRDSRMIGYDGDFVGLLEPEDEKKIHEETVAMHLQIKKQRNGPTGTVHLTFLKQFTRFENAARISNEELT